MARFFNSIATKLSLGAALIGLVAAATSIFALYASSSLDAHVRALLAAENRLEMYSALSSQITTLAVAALDDSIDPERRQAMLEPLNATVHQTFATLQRSIGANVADAADLGLDEQSRRATRGIMVARMQALFEGIDVLAAGDNLQARLNIFSTGFQPLLGSAIADEQRGRDLEFKSIARIRQSLNRFSVVAVAAVLGLFALYVLALVRPMISRINHLRSAATRIGREEFAIALPGGSNDEIGRLFVELNGSAAQLAARKSEVEAEWKRLSQVIDERTEALQTANDALAKTDENRRRFFADVSHEMRTPLTVIITEAEIGAGENPDHAQSFDVIRARALSLNRRIDDLLRLARSETGALKIDAAPFDLTEAAAIACEDVRRSAARSGITVTMEAATAVTVLGDRNWVRQVILALIDNAIRHASGADTIRLTVALQGETGVARVIDNGGGVPETEQAQVFERFAQGSANSSQLGFGIGLNFARTILRTQDGELTLVSPVPRALAIDEEPGTMLTLSLNSASDDLP